MRYKDVMGPAFRRRVSIIVLVAGASVALGCAHKGPSAEELMQRSETAASRAEAAASQATAAADRAERAADRTEAIFRKHMRK